MLVWRGQHPLLNRVELFHFLADLGDFLFDVRRLAARASLGHAFFKLLAAASHFGAGEVLVAGVDCLELAAIDGDAGLDQQSQLAA